MSARAAWRLQTLGFTKIYRYQPGKADWLARGLPREGKTAQTPYAGELARKDVPTCRMNDTVAGVRERLKGSPYGFCLVVNEANVVLGRLREKSLSGHPEARVETVMEDGPTTTRPSASAENLVTRLKNAHVQSIVVTDPDGVLLGVAFLEDAQARAASSGRSESAGA